MLEIIGITLKILGIFALFLLAILTCALAISFRIQYHIPLFLAEIMMADAVIILITALGLVAYYSEQ